LRAGVAVDSQRQTQIAWAFARYQGPIRFLWKNQSRSGPVSSLKAYSVGFHWLNLAMVSLIYTSYCRSTDEKLLNQIRLVLKEKRTIGS